MKGTLRSYAFCSSEIADGVVSSWKALKERHPTFAPKRISLERNYGHELHKYPVSAEMVRIGYADAAFLLSGPQPFGGSWRMEGDVLVIRISTD